MNKNLSLSVIVPFYNEEHNLRQVVENTVDFLQGQKVFERYEVIAVDDGSKDKTGKILRDLSDRIPYLKVLTHHKNLGYGKALISGISASQYPLVLFMDGDGQFNIKEINRIFTYTEDFDMIAGYRRKRKDNFFRVASGRFYSSLACILFGLKLKDINCGFKLFKKKIFNGMNIHSRNGVFYTEILLKAKINGYKIKQAPVEHCPRLEGKAKGLSMRVIFTSMIDLIMLKYLLIRNKNMITDRQFE
jgi:glycosyltransferase involved in cell wall biosynthesis